MSLGRRRGIPEHTVERRGSVVLCCKAKVPKLKREHMQAAGVEYACVLGLVPHLYNPNGKFWFTRTDSAFNRAGTDKRSLALTCPFSLTPCH
jgi:hypothetical protein